jgi:hypothetical protein
MMALAHIPMRLNHLCSLTVSVTSPHPNSGLPEFGTLKRPKSDISDFGWGEVKSGCVNLSARMFAGVIPAPRGPRSVLPKQQQ